MAYTTKCCNCENIYFGENALKKMVERNESAGSFDILEYDPLDLRSCDLVFNACPKCETDKYLSSLPDGVPLDTFPDDDADYCKTFVVEQSVFLKILEWLASTEPDTEVDVERFYQNYVWEESEVIYEKAKEQNAILYETADKNGEIFNRLLGEWLQDGGIEDDNR